ncbi:pyrroline-5-carboxylate reductase [Virgibacillus profundi]|uniref:Pyrroline-5-carboxylate reductase n=1 Tax=Virgibacillus profundi TaxID=2024555 RepID=A0A2A2IAU6_9BACI|nr:pyrroline-5-carboxylate reductase [Virgibacillus profundi]PAV28508.1 pyrroline-5-carboxylate reductase [Virgibacillus profundi]PXY52681.1 pyrroline-5-carboxylate reductase [Virgibacillus profundi]
MNKKIAFVGAGSMAEAIISGIVKSGILKKEQILVTNKSNRERLENIKNKYDVQCILDKETVITEADIVILATKPYDLKESVESIKEFIQPGQLIFSVIAGISTDYITTLFGGNNPVVRAMPNTSATIGYSATAISAGKYAHEVHLNQAEELFETIGTTVIVNEDDMHTVTGISGSGPAYIYYLVEAMEKAATEAGFDKEIAMELITQTVRGAGQMLKETGESAAVLRKKITSPQGTTEAGIETLNKYDFEKIVMKCVKSASNRSEELGKSE